MLKEKISITAISSVSPLGSQSDEIWNAYRHQDHGLTLRNFKGTPTWVGSLPSILKIQIEELASANNKYQKLDNSVHYAIFASRQAIQNAGWQGNQDIGVNLGSSRGATQLFENYHQEYLETGKASTLSSPTTTLGNISSWVAHDLGSKGPEISHSITCSTGLHSVLNGIAWLQSGMANKFLVGGSEAPLTNFTIAQMKALKIYASAEMEGSNPNTYHGLAYPCRALDLEKERNSMVLGEGAAVACLERGVVKNALVCIEGIGYATEPLEHNTSISTDADCFQKSMKMALGEMRPSAIDAVVLHAPGTIKGDSSEVNAIKKVFGNHLPLLTTNKWKLGHTFAASGMFNLELAILMMQHRQFIPVPYVHADSTGREIKKVTVNAVGFGGNAVSLVIGLPE